MSDQPQPVLTGFPPLARANAHTLILGSMPGAASLTAASYYAHPRNAFWPILMSLLDSDATTYEERARSATDAGIAIWDVISTCRRAGSLDSRIEPGSVGVNDFAGFFDDHRKIRRVFFNGAKAESVYSRFVRPALPDACSAIVCRRLPSTSPAHAGMSPDEKKEVWSAALLPALRPMNRCRPS